MKKQKKINAINFHIWKACNFKCKYCFATYKDSINLYRIKSNLTKQEMFKIIDEVSAYGIEKISFAGGEPFLCKWLDELIVYAKQKGLTTMVITNGYLLSEDWLKKVETSLDWLTLSIDSLDSENLIRIGRSSGRKVLSEQDYIDRIRLLTKYNIKFKMNTVVNVFNYEEDISSFVKKVKPLRWKIFQVLPIKFQRKNIYDLCVSNEQFNDYVAKHLEAGLRPVVENNAAMLNSYLMIDPLGRVYDNSNLKLNYSKPILEDGLNNAIGQMFVSRKKFEERGGNYDWA